MVEDTVRQVLVEHGRLAVDANALELGSNLYDAGLTSHASVSVMLALEDTFGVEFPDEMLSKETFTSIASITAAVASLTQPTSA